MGDGEEVSAPELLLLGAGLRARVGELEVGILLIQHASNQGNLRGLRVWHGQGGSVLFSSTCSNSDMSLLLAPNLTRPVFLHTSHQGD